MENKGKELIEYKKQSIISKVFNFFKNIFFKKENNISNVSDVESNNAYLKKESISNIETNNFIIPKEITSCNNAIENKSNINQENETNENEKERFFKIYNDFKENRLKIEDVGTYDILKIQKMLEEENNIILKR